MGEIINTYPLVSVLMPVYNAQKHLNEAIDSILNQSYKNFEFIIINDGSTDLSESIIKSYSDNRIKIIENDGNKGLIYSLNYGITQCNGKYIVRMDADDISLPARIEEQVKFIEQHPEIGVCGCDYTQFNTHFEKKYRAMSNHDEILSFMIFNSSVVHPSLIIRKKVLQAFDPIFNAGYHHSEDYELWSKLIFSCQFSAVNKLLFRYRLHDNQVTNKHNQQQLLSTNKIRKQLLDKLGFIYSEEEFRLLSQMTSHQLFKQKKDIELLEYFFEKLIAQNNVSKKIDTTIFNNVISYKWYTVCGYTTLGFWSFKKYLKSPLTLYNRQNKNKLFVKTLIRWFKKRT